MGIKNYIKKVTGLVLAGALCVSLLPGSVTPAKADGQPEVTLGNPVLQADASLALKGKVTWDIIEYGSYPRTEIVGSPEDSGFAWDAGPGNYEVDPVVYEQLQNVTDWDVRGNTVLNGVKYGRRNGDDYVVNGNGYYWDFTSEAYMARYHYFRYEPIQWMVLKTDGNTALLLSLYALDCGSYDLDWYDTQTVWNNCSARTWLNGYDKSTNRSQRSYTNKDFLNTAFTSEEQACILVTNVDNTSVAQNPYYSTSGGVNTQDRIFYLSYDDVAGKNAVEYGFNSEDYTTYSYKLFYKAKQVYPTAYAMFRGANRAYNEEYLNCTDWMLRTPGKETNYYHGVWNNGQANRADDESWSNYIYYTYGVRPAMNLDLAKASWTYAGKYDTENGLDPCALGHTEEIVYGYPATCTDDGLSDGAFCTVCHKELVPQVVLDMLPHNLEEDKAVAPTCTTGGLTKGYHCKDCGFVETLQEDLLALGHKEVADNEVAATCTKAGLTSGSHCARCGEIFEEQTKVAALGHKWTAYKTTKAATALAAGIKKRTCSRCKKAETKTIAKLKATIKLSTTTRTIKKGKNYTLVISMLAKGDSVKSVVTSKKTIATVKKIAAKKYKITAKKKKGKATITVTLKSGKKATCKVTVK